ncbi:MAG: hypothetical protein MZV63_48605 [Marinilabiliales bacterium]|nr:hypothetical protein [Marinilabiliales bacterium]
MRISDEMAFINPRPPVFPMEALQLLEGLNLSPEQVKEITRLKLGTQKKMAQMEIEMLDELLRIVDIPGSKD